MTVRELIEALSKFDGGLPVYLPYAEGGVDDVKKVAEVTVNRGYRERVGFTYYGDHDDTDMGEDDAVMTLGVVVSR